MRAAAATLAAVLLAAGCHEKPAEVVARTAKPLRPGVARDELERGNLLNIAFGASVVSRTGELTLDQSALRAIDGDPDSAWNSPPDDAQQQTLVFALPARTLVEKLGVRNPRQTQFHINALQFDSSVDGVNFAPLLRATLKLNDDVQFFTIPPTEMTYLRLTTVDAPRRFARLQSVQAHGTHREPVVQQPMSGCWSINQLPASFTTDRGRVTGTIGGEHPISFDGGSDGLVYRFIWTSGPDWGFGAIDTAPDGKHLSGLRWYQEPMAYDSAESWFGERSACGASTPKQDIADTFMSRAGRYPLYGLHFDRDNALVEKDSAATLDWLAKFARQHPSQQLRLLSREYRQANADQNRRVAQVRIDSLRTAMQKRGINAAKFDSIALGSDTPRQTIENEIMRVLYGVIELQAP